MNRKTTDQERKLDLSYQREAGWLHGVVVWLFAKHINKVLATVLSRCYERNQIDSFAMHELSGCGNRLLWPKINDFNMPKPDNGQDQP